MSQPIHYDLTLLQSSNDDIVLQSINNKMAPPSIDDVMDLFLDDEDYKTGNGSDIDINAR